MLIDLCFAINKDGLVACYSIQEANALGEPFLRNIEYIVQIN